MEMKSVTAYSEAKTNVVEWVTVTEKLVKTFIVERSYNGVNWTAFTAVAAKGGFMEANYKVIDEKPLPISYYRIRTLEQTGESALSKVVSVKRSDSKKLMLLSVFPIPTTEGVSVVFNTTKAARVNVTFTNLLGQMMETDVIEALEGENTRVFNLRNFPKGAYILKLTDGEYSVSRRIIKQ